jgi:hypothetical protein
MGRFHPLIFVPAFSRDSIFPVWLVVTAATIVIPAKAGIQDNQRLGHRPAPV